MAELPKIVGQRLRASEGAKLHPDPDLLAAFVERSLGGRERVEVLEHLSRCADCREVASLASALPAFASTPSPRPAHSGWFSWPVLRWGAAAACVVVVTAAVTLRHKPTASRVESITTEQKPPALAQASPSPDTFVTKADSRQFSPGEAKSSLGIIQRKQVLSQVGRPVSQSASRAGAAVPAAPSDKAAADSAPIEMADAKAIPSAPAMVPGRAKVAIAESQSDYDRLAAGSALMKKGMTDEPSGRAVSVGGMLPANLTPRWTLSSDGTLQRSLDSGRTWATIQISSAATFRALAANGLDIWVGGSAGALFHSSDAGQHWAHVRPIANGLTLDDDIIGVEFTDLLHGKLTTAGAEIWLTADAGQTWQKQ
jgi:hypothetical protein